MVPSFQMIIKVMKIMMTQSCTAPPKSTLKQDAHRVHFCLDAVIYYREREKNDNHANLDALTLKKL